jgi:hypothetical protein
MTPLKNNKKNEIQSNEIRPNGKNIEQKIKLAAENKSKNLNIMY